MLELIMIGARALWVSLALFLAQESMADELPLCAPMTDNSSENDIAFIKGMSNTARLTKAAEYSQGECKSVGGRHTSIREKDLANDEVKIMCSIPAKEGEMFQSFWFHNFYITTDGHMNRIFTGDKCIPTISFGAESTLWH